MSGGGFINLNFDALADSNFTHGNGRIPFSDGTDIQHKTAATSGGTNYLTQNSTTKVLAWTANLPTPTLTAVLGAGNSTSNQDIQVTTNDEIQFRSTANNIASPAANELEIESPKVWIDDGFWVELPPATEKRWFGRIDGTSSNTGIAFDRDTNAVQFIRDDTVLFQFVLNTDNTQGIMHFPVKSDANRPSAGTAGRVIFNSTDGNLNIDDGTNWILPDGTTT